MFTSSSESDPTTSLLKFLFIAKSSPIFTPYHELVPSLPHGRIRAPLYHHS
ncbi:hypothetical protein Scep_027520 [Stephania cephalantha]|uniref:Uncharacterized protein n=1 Tax=Stephania cephalantha TaxID=152367 RepID=A0AAP0HHB5_9MAGN